MIYKCHLCNKEIIPSTYQKRQVKLNKPIFCSKSCIMKYRYKDNMIVTNEILDDIKYKIFNTDLSLSQIQKESGLTQKVFNDIKKKYNLFRDKETISKNKIQHMNKTIKEKYNVDHIMHLDKTKNKVVNSLKDFYISDKGRESLKQQKQTKLNKYGDENYNNRDKAKITMIKNYGVSTNLEREDIKEKIKETNLNKYGVDNAFKSNIIHELSKQKMQELYNVDYGLQNKNIKTKAEESLLEKYGTINPTLVPEIRQKQIKSLQDKYGVSTGFLTPNGINRKYSPISQINKEFAEKLKREINSNLDIQFEKVINNYSYDLCINNLLIDLNPTISHNSTYGFGYIINITENNEPLDKDYHFNRLKNANDNDYQLISIFDWMDKDKLIDLIKAKLHLLNNKINGNKCKIKEIKQKEANDFLNKYHLQGGTNGQQVCIGLFYKDELVQVQTFGKPRFNKNVEWEAIRLATKSDTYIIGGVTKGFKYFVEKYNPKNIISYNSLNISNGNTDNLQDFKLYKIQKPQCMWVNLKNNTNPKFIRDMTLRQQGIDRVLHRSRDEFPDYDGSFENSNIGLMLKEGYVEVYDCGQITYIWKNLK